MKGKKNARDRAAKHHGHPGTPTLVHHHSSRGGGVSAARTGSRGSDGCARELSIALAGSRERAWRPVHDTEKKKICLHGTVLRAIYCYLGARRTSLRPHHKLAAARAREYYSTVQSPPRTRARTVAVIHTHTALVQLTIREILLLRVVKGTYLVYNAASIEMHSRARVIINHGEKCACETTQAPSKRGTCDFLVRRHVKNKNKK